VESSILRWAWVGALGEDEVGMVSFEFELGLQVVEYGIQNWRLCFVYREVNNWEDGLAFLGSLVVSLVKYACIIQ